MREIRRNMHQENWEEELNNNFLEISGVSSSFYHKIPDSLDIIGNKLIENV